MDTHTEVIRDKFVIPRSVPWIPGESPVERHRRRWDAAKERIEMVRAWCEYRGVAFRHSSSNHVEAPGGFWKWDFRVPGKFAQWIPFAGKLNMKTRLQSKRLYSIKCHDAEQLLVALEWWLAATGDEEAQCRTSGE